MRQIFPLPQFVIKNLCLSGYCKSNLTVRSRNVGRIRQLGGASTSISDKRNLCWEPWEGAGGHSADKWKGLGRNCCAVGEIFRNGNANLKILDAPAQTSTIGAAVRYSAEDSKFARATGGARLGRPIQSRIFRVLTGGWISARIRSRPLQSGHFKTSISKTRAISEAQR